MKELKTLSFLPFCKFFPEVAILWISITRIKYIIRNIHFYMQRLKEAFVKN